MSRVIVFGLDGRSVGEFEAPVNRGWQLAGSPLVAGGGSARCSISADIAAQPWLQLGRAVLITFDRDRLPPWAGVLDTPWSAIPPHSLTLYNAEYLLSLRVPDAPLQVQATLYDILYGLLAAANVQEETPLRMGANGLHSNPVDNPVLTETLDQRSVWEQMTGLAKKYGAELAFRAHRDAANRLQVDVDVSNQIGTEVDFELKGGENCSVTAAAVDGVIWNSLLGAGQQSTAANRLAIPARRSNDSIGRWRLRSTLYQTEAATAEALRQAVDVALYNQARPRLKVTLKVEDVGETFPQMGLGNSYVVHLPELVLPGGNRGWRGSMRVPAMALDEKSNTLAVQAEAFWDG